MSLSSTYVVTASGGPSGATDQDIPAGDTLLGVPFRSLFRVRALRGLGLLVVAGVILLWPAPSDQVLGVLVGIALAGYALATSVELVRARDRRDFLSIVGIGVASGFAAALVFHPDESLRSVTQAIGGILVALALVTMAQVVARRDELVWGITKASGLALAGGLLVAFPTTLLQAGLSIAAGVLAATGLIQVFTAPTEPTGEPGEPGTAAAVAGWIRRRPNVVEDRRTLQDKVFFEGATSPTRFARFAALMAFAAVIASVGVVVESTAVVIGAMLIAPLMIPLMGTALGLTMGWPLRARRGAGIALSGVTIAVAIGALVGAIAPRAIDVRTNGEILARITPTTLDLAIAVAAGAAGAYALSRRDVSDSLPGVAVAIALVPPLTVVGLSWQQGEWAAGNGALLLFITNATAILLAGGATFILIGVAPLDRVSESQERLKTVLVGLLSAAGIVILLLALNGTAVTRAQLARDEVDSVMEAWSDENSAYAVLDIRSIDDGAIVIDLAGPQSPPDLDALLADLDVAVDDGTDVRVTWIERNQVTVDGEEP